MAQLTNVQLTDTQPSSTRLSNTRLSNMQLSNTQRWWARLVAFAALVTLATWPWPGVRSGFSAVFCEIVSPVLEEMTFDGQTRITIAPLDETQPGRSGAEEHIVADTALTLRLTQYRGQMQVEVSLRRDVFLPLVLFTAMLLVAPFSWQRRLIAIAAGCTLITLVGIASIQLTLANIFSGGIPLAPQLSEVYEVSETWGDVLRFLHERWLTPPGNRVIAPLLLGAFAWALHIDSWWPRETKRRVAATPSASQVANVLSADVPTVASTPPSAEPTDLAVPNGTITSSTPSDTGNQPSAPYV